MTPLDWTWLYVSSTLQSELASWNKIRVLVEWTWSHTDEPKIRKDILEALDWAWVPVFGGIMSVHRTPEVIEAMQKAAPKLILPWELEWAIDTTNAEVVAFLLWAGWAAHLWPIGASKWNTIVFTLPIAGSMGILNAIHSGLDMPPRIPNGLIPNNTAAFEVSKTFMNLKLWLLDNEISVGDDFDMSLLNDMQWMIDDLWIKIVQGWNSPVKIWVSNLVSESQAQLDATQLNILVPVLPDDADDIQIATLILGKMNQNAAYMSSNRESKINMTNAILFAAQALWASNPTIRVNLDKFRLKSWNDVRAINENYAKEQLLSPAKRALFDSGLWPKDKMISLERGDEELESLWYELFYKGKNADLYLVPDSNPMQIIEYRTDRKSVFDIPLDLEIEWTWEVQTEISNLAAWFIEDLWWKTCYMELPENIPSSIKWRCKCVELCRPLTMIIDWREVWLEFIVRNRLTGSLYNKYYDKKNKVWLENPYGIKIPDWMDEHDAFPKPIFTPTTKEKNDVPVNAELVMEKFPEEVAFILKVVEKFTEFMHERWYVLEDGKIELFLNSLNEVVWWDEFFSPETFRFIKIENFNEEKKFKSEGKQIIRDVWEEQNWMELFNEFMDSNPDAEILNISEVIWQDTPELVLRSYREILEAMKRK